MAREVVEALVPNACSTSAFDTNAGTAALPLARQRLANLIADEAADHDILA